VELPAAEEGNCELAGKKEPMGASTLVAAVKPPANALHALENAPFPLPHWAELRPPVMMAIHRLVGSCAPQ
jgi:hypothetical protein